MNRYSTIPVATLYGKKVYINVRYPEIELSANDVYVITSDGDRLDTLAQSYYQDPSLWWVISIANQNLPQDSLIPPPGTQIRIPINGQAIARQFTTINT